MPKCPAVLSAVRFNNTMAFMPHDIVSKIQYAFPVLDEKINSECTDSQFNEILDEIRAQNLTSQIKSLVIDQIERYIREKVAPNFWNKFTNITDKEQGFECFKCAVDDLYSSSIEFLPLLKRLEQLTDPENPTYLLYRQTNHLAQFKLIVRATLLSQLPLAHERIIEQFYKIAFNVFCNTDTSSLGKNFSIIIINTLNFYRYDYRKFI